MSVFYLLIPIAMVLGVIAVYVFFWAVRGKQFDDLERHGHDILMDDDERSTTNGHQHQENRSTKQER
ncbi:cbb3-type cytochrome oxidase assembly protein CcoS [Idiomarina tyrosinivorans]|uniref:Cbb3-type cytochrome oxidase assembly protein CcoS n=1 Tax=Idiomarina tyrosinivorans TaxID=1445662 RepID=A0A432ZTW2_9GAMM|nr:cbb3-type cytochrome oxidase assembly protein CcoS [Idiomarina tyrosinivorans]RUO81323.1 cbb3-type cytochrome oxidase assembly protein CcoS [Idiomarina tyrosinivorans]